MTTPHDLAIVARPYDHPDVQQLVEGLQQLYVEIYGGRDESPIDAAEFEPPRGAFAVAYLSEGPQPAGSDREGSPAGQPVGMGAWRLLPDGRGELKRLFVRPGHRGRGVSRRLLGWLEESARDSGVAWMVLETNTAHPEAIRLYRSAGYEPVPDYGHYADEPETVSLGREL
ncbi:GNAT family N-acetyltransferase [Frigoribacterium endophyticum]|uniref:GNAT family N-acetyltransferase n=1 Tax=Frigoribacterium endophyticum TaxID=1522176 RepID=UPI001ABA7C92|nr:GNAT superfamily N-acetyltransferase [Frigoribacterium endophyticum]